MSQLSFDGITEPVAGRILNFLNGAWSARQILNLTLISDQPGDGRDYGIGPTVAKRIINHKRGLPNRRFERLAQLNGIPGFGQEKLEDFVATFRLSNAERFVRELYGNYILLENFELKHHTITFPSQEAFVREAQDPATLKRTVAEALPSLADPEVEETDLQRARDQLNQAYADAYFTTHTASFAFALWFYQFDEDNWFTFDRMQQAIEPYLSQAQPQQVYYPFLLYKGVEQRFLLPGGITVTDLPVVLNEEEWSVTLWAGQLFD